MNYDIQSRYRKWQAESLFRSTSFSSLFARTMRFWAAPLYKWGVHEFWEDFQAAHSILDVGAGNGNFMWHALRHSSPKHITLVDASSSQLGAGEFNFADIRRRHRLEICVARAEQLPFGEESFDLVVSTGSINLWESPTDGLEQMWRVCQPKGSIWVFDQAPCRTLADAADALLVKRMFGLGLPGYTLGEIMSICRTSRLGSPHHVVRDHSFYGVCWRKADVDGQLDTKN